MNQPDYLDTPKQLPLSCLSAYGQDMHGYWIELSLFDEMLCFRWIPKGKFSMGSDKDEMGRYDDETQHRVNLSHGFWLAETTVTQALWQTVMGNNPSNSQKGKTNHFPVEMVSWSDVKNFIQTVNERYPDLAVRLPWEAEWEYACRAGTETVFSFEGKLTLDKVNYRGTWDDWDEWGKGAKKSTTPVKRYACNAWGLYNMHGNVWEWCEDNWQEDLEADEVSDPWLMESIGEVDVYRVLRGGSWIYHGRYCRSASRFGNAADYRSHNVGFRFSLGL